jgi:ssDNA-specific exonuclease RecJ
MHFKIRTAGFMTMSPSQFALMYKVLIKKYQTDLYIKGKEFLHKGVRVAQRLSSLAPG